MKRSDRQSALFDLLDRRIVVLDGAMGTAIQAKQPSAMDFGGAEFEGCNEYLVLTRPDMIADIHESYVLAGADILETDTFGGAPFVLAEYGLQAKALEINQRAAQIARTVADRNWTPDRPVFVAGSMGPTTKSVTVTGGISFTELADHYYEQAKGLFDGGVDYLLLETCQDTRNVKAGLLGIERLFRETREELPIAISGTIEATGTMLAGQSIEAFWASLAHLNLLYIGLNCATGPEFMTDHLRSLSALSKFRIACVPNAGLPDEDGTYLETPDMFARTLDRFASEGWVNLVGGCCGTTHHHIERLSALALQRRPRSFPDRTFSFLSGIDYLEMGDDIRPIIVGERTNVIGSRKFKSLICDNQFEAAAEIARAQIKGGAQVIDICLANPDRNEFEDMEKFLQMAIKMIRTPLMIDSTDEKVLEMALSYSQGKAILNSINLEDGEERFEKVVPLAKRWGAALVVGTIDEKGMGVTRQRKLDIAKRSYSLLTTQYSIAPEDIIWDPLVFPCATGDAQYVGSAVETLEGIRLIKEAFPQTKIILGISNVSFGLPTSGREVLNAVFLYHCTMAGLDLAIVNAELLQRYPSIPEEERKLSEDLLWNRTTSAIADFAAAFRTKKRTKKDSSKLPLSERLAQYILEGSKEGLESDLKLALVNHKPLEIINGPLMKGMDEVGRLFNLNELIVAEVLQSAEAMKAAVTFLEPFMEKADSAERGKIVLATVKGDVHDIGKNLVEIILSNNGFRVINLGIKIPPEQLILAVEKHKPDMLGLSGLLVKSAQQMVSTAKDLSQAGISIPILVGGAALTRNFTDKKIAPAYSDGTVVYANDAMNGLDLAKRIVDPSSFALLRDELRSRRELLSSEPTEKKPNLMNGKSDVSEVTPPSPPDLNRHVLLHTPLDEIWAYINPRMLYGRHLGLSNRAIESPAIESPAIESPNNAKMKELRSEVEKVQAICKKDKLLQPKAVYQYFSVKRFENQIQFLSQDRKSIEKSVVFPRQSLAPFLCIADFVRSDHEHENVCCFFVTAGFGVREVAEKWKQEGHYLRSHILSALALESAEGYAEWLHSKIRGMWGIHDSPTLTFMEKFQARYQGKRYSFGYPACPELENQQILFELLRPADIGIELTDGMMMDPEASVSAIVFHHPEAKYFAV